MQNFDAQGCFKDFVLGVVCISVCLRYQKKLWKIIKLRVRERIKRKIGII